MQPADTIRIVLIDDHALVRDGMASLLRDESDLSIVATYERGEDALPNLTSDNPDVILLDVRLPGLDGLAILAQIRLRRPGQRVLMLSSQNGDRSIHKALELGAAGYLLKHQPMEEVLAAIRASVHSSAPMTSEVATRLARHMAAEELTGREIEVLKRIAQGRSNKEIGEDLGISHNTVRNHIVSVLGKLGAADRAHALTLAVQRGIIDL